jgi:hypothetical protein
MTLELTAVGARAREVWKQVLPRDPSALVSQTPAWMDCVCASGRFEDATRAYVTADGQQLILPLARRRVPAPLCVASSMPFGWGTGGLISSRGRLSSEDIAAVVSDLASERALMIGVRPSPATAGTWAGAVPGDVDVVRTRHMSQTVSLSDGFDAVWKRFAATVRSNCRKAVRRGVTAERDDTGRLIPVFDALYRRSVDRWAGQQHEPMWLARWRARRRDPPEKFQTVAQRLGPACHIWVASRGGEPIAAVVVLTHGYHATMWRAAMDKSAARGTGANDLLHQLAIEEACKSGQRFYHMGDSAPSSALARHKQGFGAEAMQYTAYRFERLPLTAADEFVRRHVKRAIQFRD